MEHHSREKLLAAAAEVFSEAGYHGALVASIADKAGVAKGTVYLHFPTKEALFVETIKNVNEIFSNGFLSYPLQGQSSMTDIAKYALEFFSEAKHRKLWIEAFRVGQVITSVGALVSSYTKQNAEFINSAIEEQVTSGALSKKAAEDSELIAMNLLMWFEGLLLFESFYPEKTDSMAQLSSMAKILGGEYKGNRDRTEA